MRRRGTTVAAAFAVVGLLLAAPDAARETTAAWTDGARLTASASAAELFGCQQGPVVVTTHESAPADTVTVRGIDEECAGTAITVELYDASLGGEPGTIALTSSFEVGTGGWTAFGGGGAVERSTTVAHSGQWSLRSLDRSQTYQGPGRDLGGAVTPGDRYQMGVWVYHAGAQAEPFQLTLRETVPGTGEVYVPIANATVEAGTWTPLGGDVTVTAAATAFMLYVEATANATTEFFIDDARIESPSIRPIGGYVTATGLVTLPEPTLETDQPFTPLPGFDAMPVAVTIDGHDVPAVWDYEVPPAVEGCQVVLTGTLDPAPGATCEGMAIVRTGGYGEPGSRVSQFQVQFAGTGIATDGSHQIVFVTDLSTVAGVPSDWRWAGSGVESGSLLPYPGYSCAALPGFAAVAPGWTVSGSAYFALLEQPSDASLVCSQ